MPANKFDVGDVGQPAAAPGRRAASSRSSKASPSARLRACLELGSVRRTVRAAASAGRRPAASRPEGPLRARTPQAAARVNFSFFICGSEREPQRSAASRRRRSAVRVCSCAPFADSVPNSNLPPKCLLKSIGVPMRPAAERRCLRRRGAALRPGAAAGCRSLRDRVLPASVFCGRSA